ncbi:hypothetical protein GQ44DRAFT_706796, partial [Phaeosphaeriaceae sp. PMI808]
MTDATLPAQDETSFSNAFRPIAPAATQPHAGVTSRPGYGAITNQPTRETRVPCNFPNCPKTFRRAADCRRHMESHQGKKLKCIH